MTTTQLDLSALENALISLNDSLAVVSDAAWFNAQTGGVQNTLIAGVVKNFEFVYELSIKMIRRRLEMGSDSPAEIDKLEYRDLLRHAAEKGLIGDVEAWFKYRKMRNITAHTYDHKKAQQVYRDTLTFIGDANDLLARLKGRNA